MESALETLAKETVLEKIAPAEDPAALAAEVAHRLAAAGLAEPGGRGQPRATVAAACRGAMTGVLLGEKDLPKAAVALLSQMDRLAQEAHLDPAECMTWAMEGIAPVARMAPAGATHAIRAAVAENFMGAGEIFAELLRAAPD